MAGPTHFVTYHGKNLLYRNNKDGTFTDVTEAVGLLTPDTSIAQARPFWTTIEMATSLYSLAHYVAMMKQPYTTRNTAIAVSGAG